MQNSCIKENTEHGKKKRPKRGQEEDRQAAEGWNGTPKRSSPGAPHPPTPPVCTSGSSWSCMTLPHSFSRGFFLALLLSLSLKLRGNIQCWWGKTSDETSHTHRPSHTHSHMYSMHAKRHILYYIKWHVAGEAPTQTFPLCHSFPFLFSLCFHRGNPFRLHLFILSFIFYLDFHPKKRKKKTQALSPLNRASLCPSFPSHSFCPVAEIHSFYVYEKPTPGQSSKQITHVQHILQIAFFIVCFP